jgi:hypothetical protein
MGKKYTTLVIIIIVSIVAFAALGIMTIYRLSILQKVIAKNRSNAEINNYRLISKLTIGDQKEASSLTAYYKDGVGKIVVSNGLYTWSNGDRAYLIDDTNRIAYVQQIENATNLASYDYFMSSIPGYNSFWSRVKMAFYWKNKVKKVDYEGQSCYLISKVEDKVEKTVWVNQNTGKVIRATIDFNGELTYTYEFDIQFNVTSTADVALPRMSDYATKTQNDLNEILQKDFNSGTTEAVNTIENQE